MRSKIVVSFSVVAVVSIFLLVACSTSSQPSENAQVKAIQNIRPILGLPDLSLEYVEKTGMVNSPEAAWEVAMYKDSEGRKYFEEVKANQVVEIDGRDLLPGHETPVEGALTAAELQARAEKIAKEAFPEFSTLQPKLTYEEGQKGDNYFFTWRDNYSPVTFNRPFLQLAFVKNGQLFAYFNTLSSK